jgi:hypothetical protein
MVMPHADLQEKKDLPAVSLMNPESFAAEVVIRETA